MRHINPKLMEFIDRGLKGNGLAHDAIANGNPRALIVPAASVCVGIREQGGNNRGPMVKLLKETVGSGDDSWPWCMSFVQSIVAYCEEKTGVKSPLAVTEHCLTAWRETPRSARVKYLPAPGAIVIWRRGRTEQGHTGIVVGTDGKYMDCIEGNTESGLALNGEVVRDGGGVYHTRRSLAGTKAMEVVGFLKPFDTIK